MEHESIIRTVTYPDGKQGEMELKYPIRTKDRVYIVGCANTKSIVPWNDETAEFWGVNNLYGVPIEGQHYDRWFEVHNIWQDERSGKLTRRGATDFRGQPILDYMKGLDAIKCTVYMQKHWPELIPMSIPYPLAEIVQFFSEKGFSTDVCRYLTNSITYEIVLAIYLGFKSIHVYGVDMQMGTEYAQQRPSCEFWLGVAAGMGIDVYIPPQADLLKTRFLYGFEEKQQNDFREKTEKLRKDLKTKRIQLEQSVAQNTKAIEQYIGGEQVLMEVQRMWSNLDDDLLFSKRGTI